MTRLETAILSILSAAMLMASWKHWLPFELLETFAVVTGAACVWLVVKEHLWNFPLSLISSVAFLKLFIDSRLFGDAGLQVFFLVLGVHGWYTWLYGGEKRTALRIGKADIRTVALVTALVPPLTYLLMMVLRHVKGSAPLLDSFTTILSLAGQYLSNRKLIENWYFWIVADTIYIYLYVTKSLPLTAALYFVFTAMAFAGLASWLKIYRSLAGELGAELK